MTSQLLFMTMAVDAQEAHHGCEPQTEYGQMVGYVDDGAFVYSHRDPAVLSEVLIGDGGSTDCQDCFVFVISYFLSYEAFNYFKEK